MKRRPMIGPVLTTLLSLGNIAGGVYVGMMGGMRHAGLHVVLALVGANHPANTRTFSCSLAW